MLANPPSQITEVAWNAVDDLSTRSTESARRVFVGRSGNCCDVVLAHALMEYRINRGHTYLEALFQLVLEG